MRRLTLTVAARDALLAHAREGRARGSREVCGVLAGRAGARAVVTGVHRVENVAAHPRTAYELDPPELLATVERIEAAGDAVVGFYHSHPAGPGGPSVTDRAQATWPGHVYCIVSFSGAVPSGALDAGDARIGAWRWTGDAFETLAVTVADE